MLEQALKVSVALFMVGNLLDVGLRVEARRALAGLRDVRFVAHAVGWGFVLCPALACGIALLLPLARPYAIGLIVLGMTPCAPFLPVVARRARGDLDDAAALLLLTSLATVVYLPAAVPVLAREMRVAPWDVARPLAAYLLAPLAAGLAIHQLAPPLAARLAPPVARATGAVTLAMLALCAAVYERAFVGAVGTYAFAAQILFFSVATIAPYALAPGLPHPRRAVLALGMSTRNLGAALAPMVTLPGVDHRAVVMVAIAVPMQVIFAFGAAAWLRRRAPAARVALPGA